METKQSNNSVAKTDAVKIANQRALFSLEWENDTVFKKRELNYKTKAAFQKDLEAGKISKYTTVFIKDSKEIYKNGQYYGNSEGSVVSGNFTECMQLNSELSTEILSNLKPPFGKLTIFTPSEGLKNLLINNASKNIALITFDYGGENITFSASITGDSQIAVILTINIHTFPALLGFGTGFSLITIQLDIKSNSVTIFAHPVPCLSSEATGNSFFCDDGQFKKIDLLTGFDEISLSQDVVNGSTNSGNFTEEEYNKILAASEKGFIIVNLNGAKLLSNVSKNVLKGKVQLTLSIGQMVHFEGVMLLANNITIKDKSENYAFTSDAFITNIYNGLQDGHIKINTNQGADKSEEIDLIVNGDGTKFLANDGQYKTIGGGSTQSSDFVIFDYNKDFASAIDESRSAKMLSAVGKPCILIYNKKEQSSPQLVENLILYGVAENNDVDLVNIDFYGLCKSVDGIYINKNIRFSQDVTSHEISEYDKSNSNTYQSTTNISVKFSSTFENAIIKVMNLESVTLEEWKTIYSEFGQRAGYESIINVDISDIISANMNLKSVIMSNVEGFKTLSITKTDEVISVYFEESISENSLPSVDVISFKETSADNNSYLELGLGSNNAGENKNKLLLVNPINYLDLYILTNSFASSNTVTVNNKTCNIETIELMLEKNIKMFMSSVYFNGSDHIAITKLTQGNSPYEYKLYFNVLSNDNGNFSILIQKGEEESTCTITNGNAIYIKDNGDGTKFLADDVEYKEVNSYYKLTDKFYQLTNKSTSDDIKNAIGGDSGFESLKSAIKSHTRIFCEFNNRSIEYCGELQCSYTNMQEAGEIISISMLGYAPFAVDSSVASCAVLMKINNEYSIQTGIMGGVS